MVSLIAYSDYGINEKKNYFTRNVLNYEAKSLYNAEVLKRFLWNKNIYNLWFGIAVIKVDIK